MKKFFFLLFTKKWHQKLCILADPLFYPHGKLIVLILRKRVMDKVSLWKWWFTTPNWIQSVTWVSIYFDKRKGERNCLSKNGAIFAFLLVYLIIKLGNYLRHPQNRKFDKNLQNLLSPIFLQLFQHSQLYYWNKQSQCL